MIAVSRETAGNTGFYLSRSVAAKQSESVIHCFV